jgi:hypothetical protein
MVVLDVISDPQIITEEKIAYWKNILQVSNIRFASSLPRNTVIGQRTTTGASRIKQIYFLFPFFPSHLALPCKAGEMVWAMFENANARNIEMGYWFCRITEPNFVDDVNHTHHARQLDNSFFPSLEKRKEASDAGEDPIPIYELRNGKVIENKDGTRKTVPESSVIVNEKEDIFERLITQTDAARITQYESIPRFRKRPGDVALEGSNNTLIVLGTDRNAEWASYDYENIDPDLGLIPELPEADCQGFCGSIDIVAGRGTYSETGGIPASTTSFLVPGYELKKELGKSEFETSVFEGDPSFTDDRSRILISQRTAVNKNFNLDSYGEIEGDNESGDAAIAIKSDKIRIIARSDISLIVTGYTEYTPDAETPPIKNENDDIGQWASITIQSNGDITFSPSQQGVIRLGGFDADKGILCTSKPSQVQDGSVVTAMPIATTAGGYVGTSVPGQKPDLGTFSTKVLIK